MDLLRTVEKQQTRENKYNFYGFLQNPFPNKASINVNDSDNRNNGNIYLPDLRRKEEYNFERLIIPNPQRPEPKIISFLMDYATRKGRGIGKTAFLNYQKKRLLQDLGKELSDNSEVILPVYIQPRPDENYKRFYNISKLIIEYFIDQNIVTLAICRLRAFYGNIPQEILNSVGNDIINTLGNDEWLKDQFGYYNKKYNSTDLNQKVRFKLINRDCDKELVGALTMFGTNSNLIKNWYFYKQKDLYWKNNATKILFNDLVEIFDLAGITKSIILFDELEKIIPKLNQLERREFCDNIRYYFVDGLCKNTSISFYSVLFTIHPYLQELLIPHWESSGLQRFASLGGELSNEYTVYFETLAEETAIPLSKVYMDESRCREEDKGKLEPFDEGSVKEVLIKTMGVPGRFLNYLHTAINKGIENQWNNIGVKEIKKIDFQNVLTNNEDDDSASPLPNEKINIG